MRAGWKSYREFREVTNDALPLMCEISFVAFCNWRIAKHAARKRQGGTGKATQGTTIAGGLGQVRSCFAKLNGKVAGPDGLSSAPGAAGSYASLSKQQKRAHKRGGGESFPIDKDTINAAVTICCHPNAARHLRTSATIIALAAEGAARFDDIRKMDVAVTIARLRDGGDGRTCRSAYTGQPFANVENFNANHSIFQIAVGIPQDDAFGKHRYTVVWKDIGDKFGTAHRLFMEWYENGPRATEALKGTAYFPGKFRKRSSQSNRVAVDDHGFAKHYEFDHTEPMSHSKNIWLKDVFMPLCCEGGFIDPASMGSQMGAALASGAFHGVRRGSVSASTANDASRLGKQTQLGHRKDMTQDAYIVLSAAERRKVFDPNAVRLGPGAVFGSVPAEFRPAARAAAKAEAFVESARRLTRINRAAGKIPATAPGWYAGVVGAAGVTPVFILAGACRRFRVLDLRRRTPFVTDASNLTIWPSLEEIPVQDVRGASTSEGGHSAQRPAQQRWESTGKRSPAAGPSREERPGRPHLGNQSKRASALARPGNARGARKRPAAAEQESVRQATLQDWPLGTPLVRKFADERWYLGVVEQCWWNERDSCWELRFRFEDGEFDDLNMGELQTLCDGKEAAQPSVTPGTGGELGWKTGDAGGSRGSPMKSATFDRSIVVGVQEVSKDWRGTWRLRQYSDTGDWAPCVVRGVMTRDKTATGLIFITCPFTGSAATVQAATTLPWHAELGEAIWDSWA